MVKTGISFLLLLLLFSCGSSPAQPDLDFTPVDSLSLIPYPQSLEKGEGYYKMNEEVFFYFPENLSSEGWTIMTSFFDTCSKMSNINTKAVSGANTCHLIISDEFKSPNNSPEGYELKITKNTLTIRANSIQGITYGVQTLLQFRDQTYSTEEGAFLLPAVHIIDYPQFKHRGLLLDVCRHFFEKSVLLKYVDALASYKMNVLHLHLTEDQGWRMPIEKYPLLNEISSWRLDSNGNQYGGFYSKEHLIELVDYAADRNITIIPEIELPGHSQAALAAYPQFSCNGGPIEVVNDWGVFKEIYCAGNDSTFIFLEEVLTEVMEIFPSEYIHIGGDEAPKFRWEHCNKCQKRMRDEDLKDEHELQAYFIKRIEDFLNENERKLIGWDEILEGGLSPTAAVQSWRVMDGGKQAAETKHEVVMSPTSHCYLDYSLKSIDLQKIYAFDPIPADLADEFHEYIIGGECNMWTEHVPDEADLDSKVFPRMIGLAEVLWSYPKERNFEDFYRRLQFQYPVLKKKGINYGLETIGASITQEFRDSGVYIVLHKNLPDLTLKHNILSIRHREHLLDYEGPFEMKTGLLRVQAYKNGVIYGDEITQKLTVHQAVNKSVSYATKWSEWYPANKESALVDGKIGSIDFRDGNWQGFWGSDIDVTIDLGKVLDFKHVFTSFYQYANSWIFLPNKITVELSRDGDSWYEAGTYLNHEVDLSNKKQNRMIGIELQPDREKGEGSAQARFIRLQATNIGKVPNGHEAAGQDAWLFIDEIMIQ